MQICLGKRLLTQKVVMVVASVVTTSVILMI